MKKYLIVAFGLTFVSAPAFAEPIRDLHELQEVHEHVLEAIHEMEVARQANHYDMAGHGLKAEDALHHAEEELRKAIDAAQHAK